MARQGARIRRRLHVAVFRRRMAPCRVACRFGPKTSHGRFPSAPDCYEPGNCVTSLRWLEPVRAHGCSKPSVGICRRRRELDPVRRSGPYGCGVKDVLARIEALSTTVALWPLDPHSGSGFEADRSLNSAAQPFDVARHQLLSSVRRLREAAKLFEGDDGWGSHILMLRPALVMVAKAAWILRPDGSEERVARTVGMLIDNQRRGARAMREAVSQGALPEFGDVADKFDQSAGALKRGTPVAPIRPPNDQTMILELGADVDRYYGTVDSSSDVQLLWNASSSLSHGETWFGQLAGGLRPRRLGKVLTSRSFDAVCSGINLTSLRVLELATNAPEAPAPSASPSRA